METPNPATIENNVDQRVAVLGSKKIFESSLVASARRGHTASFDALCQRYSGQLQRAAFRITRNREDAEDSVQDALMRAFMHIQDFDGRSSFGTWLTRIAINSALMIIRKKRNSREIPVDVSDEFGTGDIVREIPDSAPNPERHYAHRQEAHIVRGAIRKLRPSLRKVVEIQHLQERSMREAAKVMGISTAAAKARLFHAKAQLRKSAVLKMMRGGRPTSRVNVLSAA
jgi:RNA polymerase sigma-70 factor (ECF subfamily)